MSALVRCFGTRLGFALLVLASCSSQEGTSGGEAGAEFGGSAGAASIAGSAGAGTSGAATASGGGGGSLASGGSDTSTGSAGMSAVGGAGAAGSGAVGGSASSGGAASGGAAGATAGTAGMFSGGAAGVSNAGGGGAGTAGMSGTGGGSAYQPCPTGGAACVILPLGDSITEGFGSSGAGYRVELFSQAVQHGKHVSFVGSLQNGPTTVQNQPFPKHHEGHDGYTIDSGTGYSGISGSITDQALSNYHPNIVLLMIGTNDINGNIDVSTAPTRLAHLIDDISTRAPTALVVVATIIPIANTGTNQKVKTYNAALPALVSSRAAQGKHVVLLDNYAAFSQDPNYQTTLMYNYLHPNDAGYAVLGRAFFGAIQGLLP